MAAPRGRFYENLGERIRMARQLAGLSQQSLARAVDLSRTSITNIEKGRQPIDVHVLVRLAEVLHTDVPALLSSTERPAGDRIPGLDHLSPTTRAWVQKVITNPAETEERDDGC